jgi:hypothetical protein
VVSGCHVTSDPEMERSPRKLGEPARQHFREGFYNWSDEHGCLVQLRRFYCDHCHAIVSWLEEIDSDLACLTGQIVSGPGVIRGQREIDRFLKQFPRARGIEQS